MIIGALEHATVETVLHSALEPGGPLPALLSTTICMIDVLDDLRPEEPLDVSVEGC